MVLHPKTPQYIRDILDKNPDLADRYGWDMDFNRCEFTPKFKVGEIIPCLVIGNDNNTNNYIDKESKVDYVMGEVVGYYTGGYGILVTKIIWQQKPLYKYYDVGGQHTLHRNWVEKKPYDSKLLRQLDKVRFNKKAFVFR